MDAPTLEALKVIVDAPEKGEALDIQAEMDGRRGLAKIFRRFQGLQGVWAKIRVRGCTEVFSDLHIPVFDSKLLYPAITSNTFLMDFTWRSHCQWNRCS